MRTRLCAVAVAAVLTAAITAGHIIAGNSQRAAAATTPNNGAGAVVGVVTTVDGGEAGASAEPAGGSATSNTGRAARGGRRAPLGAAAGARTASTSAHAAAPGTPSGGSLRSLAARRGVAVGATVQSANYLTDANYSSVLADQYSILTPENEMKWSAIEPAPGVYDFSRADLDVSFAKDHGMAVRGHNLAWGRDNPTWLTSMPYTKDQLISILHDHIAAVVGHYRGKVAQWDVVNESLSGGFWRDHIGPDYIDMAFRFAHDADPAAKLFLNETSAEGLGATSDAVYNLVRGLKQRGVPIDGVGLESHFDLNTPPLADIAANMRRLNALGVETAITELDVRLRVPASAQDLDRQRVVYNGLLATCLAAPNCKTFVTWGFTDKASWVPSAYPGYGAALPFDTTYAPKPAYLGLRAALGG